MRRLPIATWLAETQVVTSKPSTRLGTSTP
jgi:hypothetical protein